MSIALGSVTLSCINDGTNGRGILSTVVEYCAGYSPTTPPGRILVDGSNVPYANTANGIPFSDGLWTDTIPSVPAGWYLWTRTKITYDDGTTSEAFNVGKEGATIANEERQYYLSDSYVTLHGGSWSTAQPYPIPEGYYLWGRMKLTMTDGTIKYSSAVYENTLSGVMNKTNELDGYIQQKIWQTDISAAINDYDTLEGNVTIRDRISEYYQDLEGIHTTIGDTITSDDSIISNLSKTTQTANKINWIVSSGTSAANMQLTQDALTVIANNINLTGKVSFNSFDAATKSSFNTTASAATNADDLSKKLKNIMGTWVDDPTLATTYINGGYIQTHTIEAKNLATDAIKSFGTKVSGSTYTGAYLRAKNSVYSTTGSLLDLQYGNIFTPSFSVINTVPSGESLTAGAYFNGHVTAKSLSLGTNATLNLQQGTLQEGATGIVMNNGSLQASNAVIYGTIYASLGRIGGWTIGSDILYYSSSTPSSTSMILKPAGVTTSAAIGGSTGSNTWALTIKDVFGVRTDGYMFTTHGKIGGFTIDASKLYNGTNSLSSTTAGVYLGTDGIRNYSGTNQYVNITGGKITAYGAEIHGSLYSTDGTIGGLTLKDGAIYKNTNTISSTTAGIYLGTDGFRNYQSGTANVTIQNGVITANGAVISGQLHAGANSKIGPWNITTTSIYKGSNTPGTPGNTNAYFGDSGLSISDNFIVSNTGVLTAKSANLVSATIGTGTDKITIANGNTNSPSIYYKISSMSSGNTSGFYLGSDGIRIGKVYVDSSGNTNLQTGTVIGSVTANHFTINSGTQTTDKSSMYYNKSSLDSNTSGIYLGTDGIALGAKTSSMTHSPFYVDSNGNLYANNVDLTGKITATSGKIGNWTVDSIGYLKNDSSTVVFSSTNNAPMNDGYGTTGYAKIGGFVIDSSGQPQADGYYAFAVNGNKSLPALWLEEASIIPYSPRRICVGYKHSNGEGAWFDAANCVYITSDGTNKSYTNILDLVTYKTSITNGTGTINASSITGTTIAGTTTSTGTLSASTSITTPKLIGDVAVELNSTSTSPLNFNLSNVVRGQTVAKNTDVTLVDNKVYLVIFYHISNNNDCGLYIIRGNFSAVVPIKEASNVDIQYPNGNSDSARKKFRWTCPDNPVCRLEMLQG